MLKLSVIVCLAALIICAAVSFYVINYRPGVAAEAADTLRSVFGDHAVAQLESTVYKTQDSILRLRYRLFGENQLTNANFSKPVSLPTLPPTPSSTIQPIINQLAVTATQQKYSPTAFQPVAPTYTLTPTEIPIWQLKDLSAFSTKPDEGRWVPMIQDAAKKTVAFQTFLQPDAQRPFTQVRIIAFDMQSVRLHYVIGRDEPLSDVKTDRPGTIPAGDRQAGLLLAVFNGGFKARHGHFGVMSGGVVLLPPKDNLGTLAIYQDGHVKLGEWGVDIQPKADQIAWRQNGPLVVQHGMVNPQVGSDNPSLWGYTVQEMAPIWRSAVGLSEDGRVLYYFAGPSLTLPSLAKAIAVSGASMAIQLDINNYWVHFDTIFAENGKLTPQPLFEYMGKDNCDRYLNPYTRDFFYVTLNP